jgi:Na+-driven multidrug efflux pump
VIILAPYFVKVFSMDSDVVRFGSQYFQFTALTYSILGIGLLANATFQGMGHGYPPFVNILVRLLVFQVGGAYLFTLFLGLGHYGAWGAVALANISFGLISSFWVRGYLRAYPQKVLAKNKLNVLK